MNPSHPPTTRDRRSAERDLRARVHRRLVEHPPNGDDEVVRAELAELLRTEAPLLVDDDFDRLLRMLHDDVRGLGPLETLLDDAAVCEVMVNGPDDVWVERAGRLERVDVDLDADEIVRIAERVVAPLGLRLDRSSPIVDARLPDGSRVHAVIPPLAVDGPCITIRRFVAGSIGLDGFDCTGDAAAFLDWATHAGWNLLVAGGTSTGKTTLLGALARRVGDGERIVTIEETAELGLGLDHVLRLEARPANAEGVGAVSVRDLVRTSLRMRPDRIVVGEVRGAEALDLLQALNTGHDGSFSTAHANTPDDALRRLETLALFAGELPIAAVRAQIGAAIDAVVQVVRTVDGSRVVTAIAEVDGDAAATTDLFRRDGGRDRATLVAVAAPTRLARRPGARRPDPRWFPC